MEFAAVAKILGIALIFAIVKLAIIYLIPPLWNISWSISSFLFGIFGIKSKTTIGILIFIFTWLSPSSLVAGASLSE